MITDDFVRRGCEKSSVIMNVARPKPAVTAGPVVGVGTRGSLKLQI